MTENNTGNLNDEHLNHEEEFIDIQTGTIMSRGELNSRIQKGQYPGYYVRNDDLLTDNDAAE